MPDVATCPDCLQDIFDPHNRRYLYPFTNCGPRYTIIKALPYDRPYTTVQGFTMCTDCQREYADPLNRRFHAQPNACPNCGPQLTLWSAQRETIATHHGALLLTANAIRYGQIAAIKGLGGFHLVAVPMLLLQPRLPSLFLLFLPFTTSLFPIFYR